VGGTPGARGVYIGELEGTETRRLLDADGAALFASSGQLLFVRQGTLFAQDFHPVRLALAGDPFPVAEQVLALSASAAGPLAYRTASAGSGLEQFVWFDRSGKEIGKAGDAHNFVSFGISLSPDGRRLALGRSVSGNADIWLLDTERGGLRRFTFDPLLEAYPIWSPDGGRIVFSKAGKGLHLKPATGAGREELVLEAVEPRIVTDWSPNGRFLLYRTGPNPTRDIWALPMSGANASPAGRSYQELSGAREAQARQGAAIKN
jgi:hypothetical protein